MAEQGKGLRHMAGGFVRVRCAGAQISLILKTFDDGVMLLF
jgi:hypothetical protein